jgi:hypothetical protein
LRERADKPLALRWELIRETKEFSFAELKPPDDGAVVVPGASVVVLVAGGALVVELSPAVTAAVEAVEAVSPSVVSVLTCAVVGLSSGRSS